MDDKAKKELYIRQVKMLKNFLEKNAITQAQFDKSFGDLTALMFPGGDAPETDDEPEND